MATARVVPNALTVAVLLCGVTPAVAQTAGGAEIAGGYQRPTSEGPLDPQGWFLSGGFNLTRGFAIGGEVSVAGNRVTIGLPDLGGFDFLPAGDALEVAGQNATVMGGVRVAYPRRPVMLFARFLIGMERVTSDVNFFGAEFVDLSDTGPSLQVGGGIDVDITGPLAVRLLGDWRRTRLGGVPATAILGETLLSELPIGPGDASVPSFHFDTRRFGVGLVYRFGGR